MQPGTTCQGFKVDRTERVEELDADVVLLHHEETGAKIALVSS